MIRTNLSSPLSNKDSPGFTSERMKCLFFRCDMVKCSILFLLSITGCSVILPREKETVLLGAAVLGAVASKQFESVHHAMKVLNAPGEVSTRSYAIFTCSIPFV